MRDDTICPKTIKMDQQDRHQVERVLPSETEYIQHGLRVMGYRLSAVVYHGGEHIVCRVISPTNTHIPDQHSQRLESRRYDDRCLDAARGSAMDARSLVSLGTRNAIMAVYVHLSSLFSPHF